MATAAQVAEFRQANQSLVLLAQRDLRDFFASLNVENPDTARDALLAFMPDLIQTYGDVAAVLGADWYDMLRDAPPSADRFRAAIAAAPAPDQVESSVRWAVGPLFTEQPDVDAAFAALVGATQRLVMAPGRGSVFDAAAADTYRTGVARVPQGVTCRFCTMLASRGPVYRSEVSAELVVGRGSNRTGYDANGKRLSGGIGGGVKARGKQPLAERFHDNCDCMTVVVRSPADYPDGYDPDALLELYKQGSGIGRDEPN